MTEVRTGSAMRRSLLALVAVSGVMLLGACTSDENPDRSALTSEPDGSDLDHDDGSALPDGALVEVTDSGDSTDAVSPDISEPDVSPDVGAGAAPVRDEVAVAERLAATSVEAYLEAVDTAPDIATCSPEQPASGGTDACADNAGCGDGFVCRNVRVFGLDSRCDCVAAASCDGVACGAGEVCLPGTRSAQELCGGGLGTTLCNAACVQGGCASDDACGDEERCIVVRDACRNLRGTACTPATGTGCLGVAGSCAEDEVCLPTLAGEWACTASELACD